MKTKKLLLFVIATLVLVSVMGACSETAPAATTAAAAQTEWTLTVEGAGVTEFTSLDYDKLSKVTIDVVQKKKDGSETPQKWEGALMKDVVAALGVSEYTSITLTASDDYTAEYTKEIVDDSLTVLGTVLDGAALGADGGYVKAIAGNQGSNTWVKNLVKITVNK